MMNQEGYEINQYYNLIQNSQYYWHTISNKNDDHLDPSVMVSVYFLYIIQKQSRSLIMIELDSRTFHYANRCKTEHKY